ncbi:hypothetical protein ID866_1097 [Astraeus odoratus]|nr:hypothetical protein ID866_1097 [Astraeus odoratus]
MQYVNPSSVMINPSGPGSAHHYALVSNPPPHPSLMHSEMPGHWVLPDGRRVVKLPRPDEFTPPMQTLPPVTFSTRGWPGVRIKDLKDDAFMVDCPYDTPFAHLGWRSTVINLAASLLFLALCSYWLMPCAGVIQWPGYGSRNSRDPQNIRIEAVREGYPISRQGVAKQVAFLANHFYNSQKDGPIARGQEKWEFNRDNIRPSDLVLLSIHYYKNQWVPEFYVFE